MVRRAWKVITNNFGLKLLAALFAVILWLVVVNIDDPKISQRFSATVVIENAEYLTDQGKYFVGYPTFPEEGEEGGEAA